MGNFAEARGGLDRFSKLCGLSRFHRHGAARKNSKTQSFLSHTVSRLASDRQQGKPSMIKYKETLIKSQSRISHGFLYMASSSSSLNSLLFASDDSSLCIKIQE